MTIDSAAAGTSASPGRGLLTWIALYKLAKALLTLAGGIAALHLLHQNLNEVVRHLMHRLNFAPDSRLATWALAEVLRVNDRKLWLIASGFFVYSALYTVQGIGLYFKKPWAEWLTLITTCLLMPVEIYELFRRPSATKATILLMNIAVAVYLAWLISKQWSRAERGAGRLSASPQEGEAAP